MTTHLESRTAYAPLGTVSADMFGGNFLIDRDRMGEGTYDEAIEELHLTNLRYPGGSITEWYFDINDPDKARVWAEERGEYRELLPLSTFLAQAAKAGVGVDLVIPTASLLGAGELGSRHPKASAYEDVRRYVADVLDGKYGSAEIVGIEIGNEYWLSGGMTDVEYARIASVIAEAAQAAIDEYVIEGDAPAGWQEPEIAVQIGQYGRYSTDPGHLQNDVIMEGLSDAAAAAIDAVVAHYLTWGSYDDLADFGYYFERQQSWLEDDRFAGVEYHVTEWNTDFSRAEETGAAQASTLMWMFSEMVVRGVESAYVWPVQQATGNTLAGDEGDLGLSFAGEAFRLLSGSVSGMDLVDRQSFATGALYVYREGAETVVYIASRAATDETFQLDLASFGLDGQFHWSTELGSAGGAASGEPLITIRAGLGAAAAQQSFTLDPYGVIRISFVDESARGAAGSRPDAYEGTERDDVLTGSDGADRLHGRGGSDRISGGMGGDRIDAGAGDDLVRGGNGRDTVILGEGDDTFLDNGQGGAGGRDTVSGGAGNDRLNGRAGNDSLSGGAGADDIAGGWGRDWLSGGSGADRIQGGGGDDRIRGGNGNDRLAGQAGNDQLFGGNGDDRIFGGPGHDRIDAGDGDDVVEGGNGADTVSLGAGNDTFLDTAQTGPAGADTVCGDAGDDMLEGQGGDDRLDGGDGHDSISGGEGNDLLTGGAGNDKAWGGPGEDRISGGSGDDLLRGGAGDDRIDGGDGADDLKGDDGNDVLDGQGGADRLAGWTGDDLLRGGAGDDELFGGVGRDTLQGGAGNDRLTGGAGADCFVFGASDGSDVLAGFEEIDTIRIEAAGLGYDDLDITVRDDGTATVRFAGTEILIQDLAADLAPSHFLFG